MKKKLVFIAPHLSTGGMPQYLFKQIDAIKNDMDVYCIEWENVTGGVLVVQRNRIENVLKEKLITLHENKWELFNILERIQPDIIHLQEIPELFMSPAFDHIADRLYNPTRKYVIVETSHDSSMDVNNKKYFPDKFLLVSNYQIQQYKLLGIPCELVEHPIEYRERTKSRTQALQELGLDPNLKHIINVGLFTPRKNQAEIIEYAKKLQAYPIHFHFIGNQADNFRYYWEPLMKDFPSNCTWWNERSDVDKFYEAADLFLFTSRGHETDKETMPLVIRETIGWKVPSLIYNLPVYLNYFDKFDNIQYLDFNSLDMNVEKIVSRLGVSKPNISVSKTSCAIVSAYPNTKSNIDITRQCLERLRSLGLTTILATHCDVPDELYNLADHVIVDTNNILTKHTFYSRYWYEGTDPIPFKAELDISKEDNNMYHGPAVYTNYYNGMLLAHRLGFEKAYCLNFDVLLNNNTPLVDGELSLKYSKGKICKTNALEGNIIRTFWVVMNVEFFLRNFPIISNKEEYETWASEIESESNGLENIWYHALKNKLHELTVVDDADFTRMFEGSVIDICSQVEYATVLPVKNDDSLLALWCTTSNHMDARILNIWEGKTLLSTVQIDSKTNYYNIVPRTDHQVFTFEFVDARTMKVLTTKKIVVDKDYNLKQNGMFTYENR